MLAAVVGLCALTMLIYASIAGLRIKVYKCPAVARNAGKNGVMFTEIGRKMREDSIGMKKKGFIVLINKLFHI